jgi:hypothetical protein
MGVTIMRIRNSLLFLVVATSTIAMAGVANAIPRGTPAFRACLQEAAHNYFYGNEMMGTGYGVFAAIHQATTYCAGTQRLSPN